MIFNELTDSPLYLNGHNLKQGMDHNILFQF